MFGDSDTRRVALGPLIVVLAFLSVAAAAFLFAEPDGSPAEKIATQLRDGALEDATAWDTLTSLVVEVGPRFAGTPGDRAAVAWALRNMKELGLENVHSEPVTVPQWIRGDQRARILEPFPQKMMLLALGGSIGTPPEGVSGEVVEVADLEGLAALSDEEVRGKIVFFNKKMERARNGSGYGPTVAARGRGPSAAARKGASAVILRSVGTGTHRFPHTGALRYADDAPKIPAAALAIPDADILAAQIATGHPVRFELFLGSHYLPDAQSANVIGEVVGRELPDEVVLLGAHLDSWDVGSGAIDDGTGCAIVMAAAKLIADLPQPPRRTVRVVLFANEEFGLSGAKAHRDRHQESYGKYQLAMEADFGAGHPWRFAALTDKGASKWIEGMARLLEPLGIETFPGDRARGGADLRYMKAARVPLADVTPDGTYYFDYHHTEDDTLDKVDPEALAHHVAAYATVAYLAAEADVSFGPAPEPENR